MNNAGDTKPWAILRTIAPAIPWIVFEKSAAVVTAICAILL
jgi:hypothetical protein